jgi:predicted Zn finger-like uncharacterized protein
MKITCPECSEQFDVSSEMIGKKAKCGECAHVFVVPEITEKKTKKSKPDLSPGKEVRQKAWLSLYLAGMAVGLLLFRGHQVGMIAALLMALAIESAALFLAWRGFMIVFPLRNTEEESGLVKTAVIVNGIMMGLLGLSLMLTIYTIVAGQSSAGSGLGGLDQIMKQMNEVQKMIPK